MSSSACRAYAAGYCPRGGSCRFSHESGRRPGICYNFARTGHCRYGVRCKFLHDPPKAVQAGKRGNGKQGRARGLRTSATPADKIDNFFSTHSEFDYDPSASVMDEFYRMCDFFGWEREDPDRKDAKEEFRTAMVQEFNSLYGEDIDDLLSWQDLCKAVRIHPVPNNVETCRKVRLFAPLLVAYLMNTKQKIREIHVNLVDLVEQGRTGKRVRLFSSLEKLREYTIETGKFFPKESAYAGGVLKFLLREILAAS
ncbi:hypothetical protein MMC31_003093 [Peltigera leucophlebia]|nr:hypothetical protein [Peltigera leucophlebia]